MFEDHAKSFQDDISATALLSGKWDHRERVVASNLTRAAVVRGGFPEEIALKWRF